MGVIGGMGPAASARFYALLTEFTKAERDCDHMEILIKSTPSVPDRTEFILGRSASSPLPHLAKAAKELCLAGAELVAVPCNTAEFFHAELQALCPAPVLRTAYESARFAAEKGVKKLGILATEGTVRAGIYQKHLSALGVSFALPSRETQEEITELIYSRIKKGRAAESTVPECAVRELEKEGCERAVLGCTELSLITPCNRQDFFIDSLAVLAARCVELCGYTLSEKGALYSIG